MSENRELRMISRFLRTIFAAHIMILWIGCDQNIVTKSDIVYQSIGDVELSLDLYFSEPQADTLQPAVLLVHGGGWREGDRKQLRGYGILLAREGFVCLCCCYRLSTEDILPAQIQDVNCAIRYLRSNSEDLGIDPDRIGITGNSAGGHLSLMAGLKDYDKNFEGACGHEEVTSEVKAICAIYPPAKIRKLEKDMENECNSKFGV